MATQQATIRAVPKVGEGSQDSQQENYQGGLWQRFAPHAETYTVTQQAKGIFLPYPLLAIIVPLLVILVGGIIGLCTMVYSMNNAMLIRDADYRDQQRQSWEKIEQMMVYIHNDRERLARLEAERDSNRR